MQGLSYFEKKGGGAVRIEKEEKMKKKSLRTAEQTDIHNIVFMCFVFI